MNTLSLSHRKYIISASYNADTQFYEIEFINQEVGDTDHHHHFNKKDMELLRDNAKRLYEAIDTALREEE